MATQSLTYAEIGKHFGISPESARKKVRAMGLPSPLGNDGKARVLIDLEKVECRPRGRPVATLAEPSPVHELQARVAVLEAELAGERRRADAEVCRAEEIGIDRDHWRAMAQRSWWQRLVG